MYHIGKYTLTAHTMEVEDPDSFVINNLVMDGLIEQPSAAENIEPIVGTEEPQTVNSTYSDKPADVPDVGVQAVSSEDMSDWALSVIMPLDGHSYDSIANIVYTIYAKGKLLSLVTHGFFVATEGLVGILRSGEHPHTLSQALHIVNNAVQNGELWGVTFNDDTVAFKFGHPEEPDVSKAWIELADAINQTCIERKRVIPKKVNDENEKFAMRIWLTRIGMGGEKYKKTRNILYKNLSGHTAFRTQDSAERWKAKHQTKGEAE